MQIKDDYSTKCRILRKKQIDNKYWSMLSLLCRIECDRDGVIFVNICKLRRQMVANKMSVMGAAELLGISKVDMYRKLFNPGLFTIGDAIKLKDGLSLSNSDAIDIFFSAGGGIDTTIPVQKCHY